MRMDCVRDGETGTECRVFEYLCALACAPVSASGAGARVRDYSRLID